MLATEVENQGHEPRCNYSCCGRGCDCATATAVGGEKWGSYAVLRRRLLRILVMGSQTLTVNADRRLRCWVCRKCEDSEFTMVIPRADIQ